MLRWDVWHILSYYPCRYSYHHFQGIATRRQQQVRLLKLMTLLKPPYISFSESVMAQFMVLLMRFSELCWPLGGDLTYGVKTSTMASTTKLWIMYCSSSGLSSLPLSVLEISMFLWTPNKHFLSVVAGKEQDHLTEKLSLIKKCNVVSTVITFRPQWMPKEHFMINCSAEITFLYSGTHWLQSFQLQRPMKTNSHIFGPYHGCACLHPR